MRYKNKLKKNFTQDIHTTQKIMWFDNLLTLWSCSNINISGKILDITIQIFFFSLKNIAPNPNTK